MLNTRDYTLLRKATTKPELAQLLGVSPSFLTNVLYKQRPENLYHQFSIAKRAGGKRTISAPTGQLKDLQRRLSDLLLDCKDVIHHSNGVKCKLSHGFERNQSIISNASIHVGKKNVLNLDLEDFFGSFNFGRVRGFFIKNRDFQLDPAIATVIAQIACFDNKLPQGSPCSPTIANLIANSLDIKLAKLARKSGCSYTRYADDITFSTCKKSFSTNLVKSLDNFQVELGGKLLGEIRREGYSVNPTKTRVQFKNSRQDATGLVVNKKVNVKSDYWRSIRAMAHNQFKTGTYDITVDEQGNTRQGNLSELEGRLTFIDHIDKYNNALDKKNTPKAKFVPIKQGLMEYRSHLNSREKVYSRFLYYKHFFASEYPTILTEGKTDNVYLKCALSSLHQHYPNLVRAAHGNTTYKPLLSFPDLNARTGYFLDLDGGASHFLRFVQRYISEFDYFEGHAPKSPVILVLDNDTGPETLLSHLAKNVKSCPDSVDDIRNSGFLPIFKNLYLILTPLNGSNKSDMEDLFYQDTLDEKIDGKSFSKEKKINTDAEYGKHVFSTKVIKAKKASINFDKFKAVFDLIEDVVQHFNTQYP